jgi:hypothetical protein
MCNTPTEVNADKDILYRVAYNEAVRALAEQQAEIDSFRSRAGLLLSSTAITTSFLGAHSFDGGGLTATSWLALIAFVGAATISLAVLWPHPWQLSAGSRAVVESYIEGEKPAMIDELHRDLSIHMHRSYAANRIGAQQLALLLQIASGLLTLEVVLWIISIATHV